MFAEKKYFPVPGHLGYYCNNQGKIFSRWKKGGRQSTLISTYRLLKPGYRNGYMIVVLMIKDKFGQRTSKKFPVHRLVFAAFNKRWPSEDIHHINRKKEDNTPENLMEMNHSDHIRLHRKGQKHSKKTKKKISESVKKAYARKSRTRSRKGQ